ncbi:MFS transporter [Cellulomonas fengjieae]|uniref:MFS transporter n=1 Tax=Cellulomonas fengjieae TaxID=2819978 RepID=A0ABS3SI79_9CELL|nr:MFS transporter [Cellulomonas fengjieae]MBO3085451.1 MFS transporter [Cellulomonas fengjieae]QVI66000.1 MFS transporter [Cellulomonas fengjieae]
MTQQLAPTRAESLTPAPSARFSLPAAGGLPFLATALTGRIPSSMIQLGLLMFVASSGLGVGLGGVTVAAVGIGTAVGAPLVGRSVDRWGPLPVVVVATLVQVTGLLAVLEATQRDAAMWAVVLCAGVVGAANPQVGSIARSRWSHLGRRSGGPDLVHRAMGYEVAADEVGFIVGPVAAGLLVALLGPVPALWVLIGLAVLGQGAFAVYLWTDRADWPRHRTTASGERHARARLRLAPLVAPMLACLAVGAAFGSTQTALTAVNTLRGTEELTGLLYACVGLGSAIASLWITRLVRGGNIAVRVIAGGAAVLAGALGLTTLPGAWGAAAFALVLGAGAGTLLVSSYARAEQVAPPQLVASTMSLLATALVLGLSAGAATSGALAGTVEHAFWPAAAAGVIGICAGVGLRTRGRRTRS